MSLKVFEVVSFWPAEVFIQRHLSSFSGMAFSPKIVTARIDNSITSSSIQPTDLKALELPRFDGLGTIGKIKGLKYLWNSPRLIMSNHTWQNKLLIKFFSEKRPDLIHFHWANTAVRLSWIPLSLGIPYSLSMRGHDINELALNAIYVNQLSNTINASSGIHSVSEAIWQKAVNISHIDASLVFHKTIFTTVPTVPNLPSRIINVGRTYTFISIGRLNWMKNYIGLLIAFSQLLSKGLNARLVIVGDGDEKENSSLSFWTKYLNLTNFVSYTGTVTFSAIESLIKRSDGYIQSSIAEGFSNSLAEAMALGLPVFATSVGGTEEIIKDSVNGFILDPVHPENWWEKLILIQDREKMQSISTQAWKDASAMFSARVHAEQFIDFYSKCVKA